MTYSKKFEDTIAFTLQWEGTTLECVKGDPGGVTFAGIDQRDHPDVDVKHLTLDGAKAIYHAKEWQWCHGEQLPQPWATILFDCTVNPGRAALKWAQSAVGAKVDGIIGLNSIAAIESSGAREIGILLIHCENYYRNLADKRKDLAHFLPGWINRNNARRELIK